MPTIYETYSGHPVFGCSAVAASGIYYGGDPLSVLKDTLGRKKYPFFVFADATGKGKKETVMKKLKEYVEKEKLGAVYETEDYFNECHGPNYITIYIFRPDWASEEMKVWCEKHKPKAVNMKSEW